MPAPESLGPYRILKTIGRGGMGTVYAAVDEQTGNRVAVKLIAHQVSDDPPVRDRFTSEIKSLARLRHRGIVQFMHSYIDEEGQMFYSMELVEGESLQSVIRREKRIPWHRVIEYAIQICSALKHAHDAGVIHRDLKPANLMLTAGGTIKLVDFGIAKLFGDSNQTRVGSVLGTADFMAPEQVTNTNITPRTDLYALGNLMYAMLSGRPPFTGKKATEVIEALKNDQVIPLDLIDPYLPDELVELVHHLLEKDPAKRPPTALVVMKRLQSMQVGLQRAQAAPAPDEIPTHVPDSDPSGDTSSNGLSRDPASATNEVAAGDPAKGTVCSQPDMARPTAATVVSRGTGRTVLPDGSVAPQKDDPGPRAIKDFHLAEEHAAGRPFGMPEPVSQRWQHWFVVTMMIAVLAGGAALFFYAVQPPSADQLYETARGGDVSSMKTFLRRFPEDPRFDEIQTLQLDARVEATLKRLNAQLSIGVASLSAAEEGFVAALNRRLDQPEQSLQKIQQWLNVYDKTDVEDEELAELVELAQHERRQLSQRQPVPRIDPRAQQLLDEIDQITQLANSEEVKTRLNGILVTFEDAEWAAPALERAQQALMQMQRSTEP